MIGRIVSTKAAIPTWRASAAPATAPALQRASRPDAFYGWMWVFLAAGLAWRIGRYLLHFPLRGDEAMLALNLLDFPGMSLAAGKALHYNQAAPPLFLLFTQALRHMFSPDERVLRALPLLGGAGALLIFYGFLRGAPRAQKAIGGLGGAVALGLMAVSATPVMAAVDFKPYALDLLFGVIYLALGWRMIATGQHKRPLWRGGLWVLLALAPLSIALSFPAAFLFGGISLALAPAMVRRGKRGDWAIYLASHILAAAAFFWAIAPTFTSEYRPINQTMQEFWKTGFPGAGISGAGEWFLMANIRVVFSYPFKDHEWCGLLGLALAVTGAVTMIRRRQLPVLGLLIAPMGLTILAAVLRKYPYGGDARLQQHLAPAVFLLMGLGVETSLAWLAATPWKTVAAHALLAGLFLLVPFGFVHDWRHPYLRPAGTGPALDVRARAAAQEAGGRLRVLGGKVYARESAAALPSVFAWYLENQVPAIQWNAPPPAELIARMEKTGKPAAFAEIAATAADESQDALPAQWRRTEILDEPFLLEKGGEKRIAIRIYGPAGK